MKKIICILFLVALQLIAKAQLLSMFVDTTHTTAELMAATDLDYRVVYVANDTGILYTGSADGTVAVSDNDPTNEIQDLTPYQTVVGTSDWDKDSSDDFNGDYNALSNKPTALSEFTNDQGFITSPVDGDDDPTNELQDLSPYQTIIGTSAWDKNAADDFSGSYNDLTDVPTVAIDDLTDVTSVTAPAREGDVLVYRSGTYVQETAYSYFCIFAEESADLNDARYEWSFGNGNETPNGTGVVIPFQCELIAMGLSIEGTPPAVVQVVRNTTVTGKQLALTSNKGYADFTSSPLSFSPGDLLNFRTLDSSNTSNGGIVTAWFRKPIF